MYAKRISILIALVTLFVVVIIGNANAAMTCEKDWSGFYENESHSEGVWCVGSTKPWSVYNENEVKKIRVRTLGVGLQMGDSGNNSKEIAGVTIGDEEAVASTISTLQTGGDLIESPTTDEWNNWLAKLGTEPTPETIWSKIPEIALGVGTFYVGWEIGSIIRGWIGIEGTSEGNDEYAGTNECHGTCWVKAFPGETVTLAEIKVSKESVIVTPGGMVMQWDHFPAYGFGLGQYTVVQGYGKEIPYKQHLESNCGGTLDYFGWPDQTPPGSLVLSGSGSPKTEWVCYPEGIAHDKETHVSSLSLEPAIAYMRDYYAGSGSPEHSGEFAPAVPKSTSHIPSPVKTTVEVPKPSKITPPPLPKFNPGPKTKEEEEHHHLPRPVIPSPSTEPTPGTREVPTPKEEEKLIEIPTPLPNEVGTVYVTRLETAGLTKVELRTLPETAIDPAIGPNEVAYTVPSEGSRVATSTTVIVEENPTDAPVPGEITEGIGGPTLPGFRLPHFGVLCEGFPFGVPCWLINTVKGWSATGSCPSWGLNGVKIHGRTISSSNFDLCKLEPVMEKARVAMLIFATMGLVLLFYRFAKGGSPPSGSGINDTGGVSNDEEYQ